MKHIFGSVLMVSLGLQSISMANQTMCNDALNEWKSGQSRPEANIDLDKVNRVLEQSYEKIAQISGKAGEFHKQYLVLSHKTDPGAIKAVTEKFDSMLKGYEDHVVKSEKWLARIFGRDLYLSHLERGQEERQKELLKCSNEISCRIKDYRSGLLELGVLGDEISQYLSQLREQEASVTATKVSFQSDFQVVKSMVASWPQESILTVLASGEVLKVELDGVLEEIASQRMLLSKIQDKIKLSILQFSGEMAELSAIIRDQKKSVREKSVQLPLMAPKLETGSFLADVVRVLSGEKPLSYSLLATSSKSGTSGLAKLSYDGNEGKSKGDSVENELARVRIESFYKELKRLFTDKEGSYDKYFYLNKIGETEAIGDLARSNLIGRKKVQEYIENMWWRISNSRDARIIFSPGGAVDNSGQRLLETLLARLNADLAAFGVNRVVEIQEILGTDGMIKIYGANLQHELLMWTLLYLFPLEQMSYKKYVAARRYLVAIYAELSVSDPAKAEILPVLLARLESFATTKTVLKEIKTRKNL